MPDQKRLIKSKVCKDGGEKMIPIYPRNSLVIHRASRGFIVNKKGGREEQEDNLDGVFVFETIKGLTDWMIEDQEKPQSVISRLDMGVASVLGHLEAATDSQDVRFLMSTIKTVITDLQFCQQLIRKQNDAPTWI